MFESEEERQARSLEAIALQLERLNSNLEKVIGTCAVRLEILGSVGVTSDDY